jgi:hypothetical protein
MTGKDVHGWTQGANRGVPSAQHRQGTLER